MNITTHIRAQEVLAMRRHMLRTLGAAVATAGAALLTVGLAGPAAAGPTSAGTHAASYPVIYTTGQGGYTVSGRWFRFVATFVKVPPAGTVSNYAAVVLGGAKVGPVTLGLKAGGGPNSIGWSVGVPPFGTGGGLLTSVNPKVGDTVLIDLYYNPAKGGVSATATDTTSGRTQSITIADGTKALFTSAEVACVIKNPASPPASNIRLWQFTNSHVTTYTGLRGSMTGNWTTSQVIDTTNGHSTGQVVMSPSFLFNSGGDFGAWLRAYLR
jgi:hypothetical protein